MGKTRIPEAVMKYFRATGSEGGKARAARHTPEELRAWGKKGGRPKGSKDAMPRKRRKKETKS